MFGYLFFFRLADKFGLPLSSGQTNLIEMIIVLRVVGVAFEINGSWLAVGKAKKEENKDVKEKDDDFLEIINPDLQDLFHYSFNYIGLLTGNTINLVLFDLLLYEEVLLNVAQFETTHLLGIDLL